MKRPLRPAGHSPFAFSMHFALAAFAILSVSLTVAAQNKSAIRFSQSISKEKAYDHLSVLASDAYEGRETGTRGAWMAAEYIRTYFKKIGLKGPVNGDYFQPVDLAKYDLVQSILTINGEAKEPSKDFVIPAYSVGINGFTFNAAEVVFAGYGIQKEGYDDYAGINVEGKVVLIFANGDPTLKSSAQPDQAAQHRTAMSGQSKIKYLMDHKALAVISIDPSLDNMTEQGLALYTGSGRTMLKNAESVKRMNSQKFLNTVYISSATATAIFKAAGMDMGLVQKTIMESGKPASKVIKLAISATAMKKETKVRAENVLGFLEGSDPKLKKEVLVVTGHYDHIGLTTSGTDKVNNGADDDGSGTTGVLMIANAFVNAKKAGHGPKRSILFMTVVGEEKGLWGSEWYSEHPIFPLENTITDLNIDMIGRGDAAHASDNNFVYIIGSDMLSSDLDRIGKKANKDYVHLKLDETYNNRTDPNRFYYRSDHYNFAKHGIPVIFYFNGVHADYHQPGDEVSKIDFPMLAKRAKLVYFTAWELANGLRRPVVDKNDDGTPKK